MLANDTSEKLDFLLHPSAVKHFIFNQAGSMGRALAELICNSSDAGATKIHLDYLPLTHCMDDDKKTSQYQCSYDLTQLNASFPEHCKCGNVFVLSDNGKGFAGREEIEQFFRTFGTPHTEDFTQDENSTKIGRFRIGRGQIMAHAATRWISGHYIMDVDLQSGSDFMGFSITETQTYHPGCTIIIKPYDEHRTIGDYRFIDLYGYYDDGICSLLRYFPIPILINGHQINTPPEDLVSWDFDDELAYYSLDNKASELEIYSMGVFVEKMTASKNGAGGVICSKKPLKMNLVRNEIDYFQCDVWQKINEKIKETFRARLSKAKKLKEYEIIRLINDLVYEEKSIHWDDIKRAAKIKFLPDIFGELRCADEFLSAKVFTIYNGTHINTAEKVQRDNLATVITPLFTQYAKLKQSDPLLFQKTGEVLTRLRKGFMIRGGFKLIPFEHFMSTLDGHACFVEDGELNIKERATLEALREINTYVSRVARSHVPRKIVAGLSDDMNAWTDGHSFVAFHRKHLMSSVREQNYGPTYLVNLLFHEYCHDVPTTGEHSHDYDFYKRYHDITLGMMYEETINEFFLILTKKMNDMNVIASSNHKRKIKRIENVAKNLICR